jgi:hypothetical protein
LLADLQIDDLENQFASAQISLESALASAQSSSEGSVQSVTDAEIALANARLQLQNAQNNLPWTSVESARLQIQSAEQQVANAQRAYDDAISHAENPATTVDSAYQQLLSAQNSLRSAQNSYYSAAQSYNNAQAQLKTNENNVIQAELNLQQAQQNAAGGVSDDQVRTAQLNIEQIQAKIAQSSLYAPTDGVVLEVTIAPGDQVTAYTAVITIGRPEPKEAIASLSFTDAQRSSTSRILPFSASSAAFRSARRMPTRPPASLPPCPMCQKAHSSRYRCRCKSARTSFGCRLPRFGRSRTARSSSCRHLTDRAARTLRPACRPTTASKLPAA